LLLLQAVLGMNVEGSKCRVRFEHPMLPSFVDEVKLNNLRVGSDFVNLHLRRHPEDVGINVVGRSGRVQVLAVK
jgi:hypothetical protein